MQTEPESLDSLVPLALAEQRCAARLRAQLGECELRLAGLADLKALLHLERYCFSPELAFGPRRWRYLLGRSACTTWSVWQQGQLVAYLCLMPHQGWRALEVRCLAVHWHQRKKGIGDSLLELALATARGLGLRALRLEVAADNEAACRLYVRWGFTRLRNLIDYYGEGQPGWRMDLPLQRPDTPKLEIWPADSRND
jgi:ribosomal-protein-alanine N-acetyltransferase